MKQTQRTDIVQTTDIQKQNQEVPLQTHHVRIQFENINLLS